jgi:hypothetical protein
MYYVFPKNLVPWRDSNPGLLFLRLMRCPLRHATRALWIFYYFYVNSNLNNVFHQDLMTTEFNMGEINRIH